MRSHAIRLRHNAQLLHTIVDATTRQHARQIKTAQGSLPVPLGRQPTNSRCN